MWSFNYLYTYAKKQPDPDHVTIEDVSSKNTCDIVTDWIKWGVTYPFILAHGVGNLLLLAYHKEFHAPTMMNIYSGNNINYMPIPGSANFHIVSSQKIMQAICKHDRNHISGIFQGKQAAEVLHPLLEDLFGKKVVDNDFLLTCFSNATKLLRTPILDMIGPKNTSFVQSKLEKIVNDVMIFLKTREVDGVVTINANEITEMFTARVIAQMLFNYDCKEADYQKIQHDVGILVKYQLIRKKPCGRPSQAQKESK